MVLNKQYQNRESSEQWNSNWFKLCAVYFALATRSFNANKIINDFFLLSRLFCLFFHSFSFSLSLSILPQKAYWFCWACMYSYCIIQYAYMFLLSIYAEGSESLINLWHVIHVCTSIIIINYDLKTLILMCVLCSLSLEPPWLTNRSLLVCFFSSLSLFMRSRIIHLEL